MYFNETAVSLFNESDSYFNLLVFEKDERNIYRNTSKNLIVGKLKDINYKIVTVEEIALIDSEYYYKINYVNKIKGYFKADDSIIIIPKDKQQVKLSSTVEFNNEINMHLSLNNSLFEEVKNKIAFSTAYAVYQDKVFEMIVYKNEIVGFFYSNQLDHLIRYSVEFNVTSESKTYKDSSMSKQLEVIGNNNTYKFRSDYIIPTKNIIRFKNNDIVNWIPISATNINYVNSNFKPDNASDTLLKSLLYQYKDKLRKSHAYSLKIMNTEIKKIKGD